MNNATDESSYEADIQAALYDLLGKVTPFVKIEAQGRKFDLVAYIPHPIHQMEGFAKKKSKRPTDITCYHRFRKTHCRRKLDKLLMDIRCRDKLDSKNWWKYKYRGKIYGDDTVWNAVKKECICIKEDCEDFNRELKFRRKMWREAQSDLAIRDGLHTFEIKSDYDSHERLPEQVSRGLRVADYAWLVVGQSQPVPEWLPPYCGVLRFSNTKQSFILVQRPHNLNETFTYYRHVLGSEGFSSKNSEEMASFMSGHILQNLVTKWLINSIFYWDHECAVIDMIDELDHLAKTAHWVKTKREEKVEPATIQKKLLSNEYLEELT